jgi:hypothetical protein
MRTGAHIFLLLAAMVLATGGLFAQNYSWDARNVGMGGVTTIGQGNLAAALVPPERNYTSIVVPLGLVQVFSNLEVFDPGDPGFDALRAIDYVGNPLHYSFNRSQRDSDVDFLKNIIDSGFDRDLNTYRGFAPPEHLVAGGLLAPSWGYTFKLQRGANQSFQGLYLGAGPYVALQTDLRFDPQLVSILGSPVAVTVPANTTFVSGNSTVQQTAIALTAGYRAKLASGSGSSSRDGVYLLMNFNYLIGLRQDTADLNLQIATDAAGLVTLSPLQVPLAIDHFTSGSGRGFSTDVGVVLVRNGWEAGVGVNGIANRIDWTDHRHKLFSLTNLTTGVDLVETSLPAPTGTLRRELPEQYVANLGYHTGPITLRSDWSYELQKLGARAGGEYRAGPLAFRGGVRYGLQEWNPTGGIGLNLTSRFGIDVGLFGNSTNLEQRRSLAVAVSLRIERGSAE